MNVAGKSIHPLVATAAIAVTAVSVLGAIILVTNQVSAHRDDAAAVAAVAPAQTQAPDSAPGRPAPRPLASGAQPAPGVPPAPPAPPSSAGAPPAPPPVATAPACVDCATVAAVRTIRIAGNGTGLGAVAGGVVGGVVGNQVGRGGGRTTARILGAIGGAVAGHEVEKQARATTRYEVDVRLDDGSQRTISVPTNPGVRVGDRVRVDGNQIAPSTT
jgi:outer membrane lipoprotein SlyB